MTPATPLAMPAWWMAGAHLARVTSVEDPNGRSRVRVRMLSEDSDGDGEVWARVAVPFAGDNRGAFLIPDVGDEVVVVFVGNSADVPIVIGSLWNGATDVPERIGGDRIDRWTLTGKAGTRIAIVESGSGQEKVEIETPAGVKAVLTDAGGQSIELSAAGNTVKLSPGGVDIQSPATVSVKAAKVTVNAGMVDVTAAVSKFSGLVTCDILQTNSVISASYTPGAGNVW